MSDNPNPDTTRPDPSSVAGIDAEASTLMKRGLLLMEDAESPAAREALRCFDAALELRRQLPLETAPRFRYGLAACWLNRAEALMRLGEASDVALALQAYDEALVLLRTLPLADETRFARRLAIAHQNRGLALQAQGAASTTSAVAAFLDAIAVLEHPSAAAIHDRQYLLAAVWMNLANVQAAAATVESHALARHAGRQAIALVAELEDRDLDAAEVGLKARHIVCRTLVDHLSRNIGRISEEVHDATDVVDDGLRLARRWEAKGVERLRLVADDLFRFGARVYELYQPQFLAEFLSDNADRSGS